jgi:hypothetical protein
MASNPIEELANNNPSNFSFAKLKNILTVTQVYKGLQKLADYPNSLLPE